MASAACAISLGFRSSAEPGTTNTVSCSTVVGFASAAAPVGWAGKEASRTVSDWLPRIDEKLIDPRTGCLTPRWYNYLRELGDRLGGVKGPTVGQIQTSVSDTQVQLAATTNYAVQVSDYAQSISAQSTATAQVAADNGLAGSSSIPEASQPPRKPFQDQLE